jgi:hypothetical protein
MGRRRRKENYIPQKTKTKTGDLLGIEENGYPIPDPNKTVINVTSEPSDSHKNPSKRKSWKKSLINSWRG